MGVSIAWLGIKGVERATSLKKLGLIPTIETQDFLPSRKEPSYTDQVGKSGWHVIVGRSSDNRLISDPILEMLSEKGEIITCAIEEHVMFAKTTCWKDGRRIWSVSHEGESEIGDIRAEGQLPEAYCRHLTWAQGMLAKYPDPGDYMFEVITRLASDMTGFKHDETLSQFNQGAFTKLLISETSPLAVKSRPATRTGPGQKHWWTFWKRSA